MSAAALSQPRRQPQREACRHRPPCPAATAGDAETARVVDARPELGWDLLCNGIVRRTQVRADKQGTSPRTPRIGDAA